jgi:hypothetical protein
LTRVRDRLRFTGLSRREQAAVFVFPAALAGIVGVAVNDSGISAPVGAVLWMLGAGFITALVLQRTRNF